MHIEIVVEKVTATRAELTEKQRGAGCGHVDVYTNNEGWQLKKRYFRVMVLGC